MTWRPPKPLAIRPERHVLPLPRSCSRCNQPTITTTARGRAVHPSCEEVDYLDVKAWRAAIGELTLWLAPKHQVLGDLPATPAVPAPCDRCGSPTAVLWRPENVWRCHSHNPLTYIR